MKNEPPTPEPPDGADPSMEEILASIRRILNDDDVPAASPAEAPPAVAETPAPEDDVLILDQSMLVSVPEPAANALDPEAGAAEDFAPEPAAAKWAPPGDTEPPDPEPPHPELPHPGQPEPESAAPEPMAPEFTAPEFMAPEFVATPPEPEPVHREAEAATHAQPIDPFDPLASTPYLIAPEAAAAAASSVDNLVRTLTAGRATQVYGGGPTLEDMVRTELRPLLKEWLDAYLPPMVERLVRVEIERVVGRVVP